jgi:hypothetical protein
VKLLLGYIFLFVLSIGFGGFATSELSNLSEKTVQYTSSSNQSYTIITPYHGHSEHDFAMDIEEEDDKLKWRFSSLLNKRDYLNHYYSTSKTNNAYLLKFITSAVSRYILLETFRI